MEIMESKNELRKLEVETLSDKELLTELGKRIKAEKIKGYGFEYGCCHGFTHLYTGKTQGTYAFWKSEFRVDLHDGEIEEKEIDAKADKSNQEDYEKPTK